MTTSGFHTLHIPDSSKAAAGAALDASTELDGLLPDNAPGLYGEYGAKHLRNHLPAAVLGALAQWRHRPTSWLTLTNLPGPTRPVPTPTDGFCDESLLRVPNLVHFGLLRLLGLTPVAYQWENEGRLIRNVAPRAAAARALTSWGYGQQLDWHTDDSILDHRADADPARSIPHCLSFFGMRNEERVPTDLLPVDTVLETLSAATAEALRRPEFAVTAPESYTTADSGKPLSRSGVPMLWTLPDGSNALRYGPGRTAGLTPGAREALERFEDRAAALPGFPVLVEEGGFHLFDNRRVMHRRVPFEPAAQGRARWLRRCYAHHAAG
ncbi:clavaminate synthase [Streptomyces agglomeratus]|uniref:Clavaminate synthase n=1 Tax=Streptomyces agglomeratus TaxID=285458 RepID=A0A1E5PGC8_9ACTN|nr:TauD/TfdA family dioxygenase [Streptomyces agglomeratus]OEJ28589.1 clavaminate synthase [Streptomyces agglomeratus]OEJ49889.1 clavaminate synthase [Streptomyces agglomeratus]OEJ57218.1 clavaminate synthase [Streptomyces agglomeratus]